MLNRILGGICAVWGGAILVSAFTRGVSKGGGAYAAGEYAGYIFGGLLLVAGLFAVFKSKRADR